MTIYSSPDISECQSAVNSNNDDISEVEMKVVIDSERGQRDLFVLKVINCRLKIRKALSHADI